jgi:hypothetical protein
MPVLGPRPGGDGVKVPMLGEERHSSDAISETLVLKLVLARLEGSGWSVEERSAPTTAEIEPQEGWTRG